MSCRAQALLASLVFVWLPSSGFCAPTSLENASAAYQHAYYAISERAYQQHDYATWIKIDRKFAEEGVAEAQAGYGCVFYNGEGGVPIDYKKAMSWFRRAEVQDDVWAQGRLGEMYFKGEGVPKDKVLADMWWNLAARSDAVMTAPSPWTLSQVIAMNRDRLERKLSPSEVRRAREMAVRCRASKFAVCSSD